jgi:hypothetical protein
MTNGNPHPSDILLCCRRKASMDLICDICQGGKSQPKCACKCNKCDGRGEILITCPRCLGAERVWFGLRNCPTGEVHSRGKVLVPCPSCGGRKRDPKCLRCKGGISCPNCNGQHVFHLETLLSSLPLSKNWFILHSQTINEYTVDLVPDEWGPKPPVALTDLLHFLRANCSAVSNCGTTYVSLLRRDRGVEMVHRVGEDQYVL